MNRKQSEPLNDLTHMASILHSDSNINNCFLYLQTPKYIINEDEKDKKDHEESLDSFEHKLLDNEKTRKLFIRVKNAH